MVYLFYDDDDDDDDGEAGDERRNNRAPCVEVIVGVFALSLHFSQDWLGAGLSSFQQTRILLTCRLTDLYSPLPLRGFTTGR